MNLSDAEQAMLDGRMGQASAFAMDLLLRIGQATGAKQFQPIAAAYVNTCFATIAPHTDLLKWLVDQGAQVAVPTHTNVGTHDPANPDLRPDADGRAAAVATLRLKDMHRRIGCHLTMTCAPYQLPDAPLQGAHVACSESNAVSYFNSVVGARTAKYGDYLDIAAALTGRVPLTGLHTDAGRRATVAFEIAPLPERLAADDLLYQLVGHALGRRVGKDIPVLVGLPETTTSDNLRSISAAAAASGGVAMYHAVGHTPEAPTLALATDGVSVPHQPLDMEGLTAARAELNGFDSGAVNAVTIGTPHASLSEVGALIDALDGRQINPDTPLFVQMNAFTKAEAEQRGWVERLQAGNVTVVVDTCLYWRPNVAGLQGRVMTNSAKFAYYAPGELGLSCRIGSLRECVESAVRGIVWSDPELGMI